MASLTIKAQHVAFGGQVRKYEHASESTGCAMKFTVFLPPGVTRAPVRS